MFAADATNSTTRPKMCTCIHGGTSLDILLGALPLLRHHRRHGPLVQRVVDEHLRAGNRRTSASLNNGAWGGPAFNHVARIGCYIE